MRETCAVTGSSTWSARVRYGECDQQGVVFNAHYLLYCDESMAAYCRARDLGGLAEDVRLVSSTLTWAGPARYGDVIDVMVRCVRIGNSSFDLEFDLSASGKPCCTVRTTYVYTDPHTGRPVPIPDSYRAKLS